MKALPWLLCALALAVPLALSPKVDRRFEVAWSPGVEHQRVSLSKGGNGETIETHSTDVTGRDATPFAPLLVACAGLLGLGLWWSRSQPSRAALAARRAGVPIVVAMVLSAGLGEGSGGWPDLRPQVIAAVWAVALVIAIVRGKAT